MTALLIALAAAAYLVAVAFALAYWRSRPPVYAADVLDWRLDDRLGRRVTVTARVVVRVPELGCGLVHLELVAHLPAIPIPGPPEWCLYAIHVGGPDEGEVSAAEAELLHLGAALRAATAAADRTHGRMVGRLSA